MKSYWLRTIMVVVILFGLFGGYCSSMGAQTAKKPNEELSKVGDEDTAVPLVETKKEAERAKTEAEIAKERVEHLKRDLEIQKKTAELKRSEYETAKKETAILKETAKTDKTVKKAAKKAGKIAKRKKKEAKLAVKNIKLYEDKLKDAQDGAELAEEKSESAQIKATDAEMKIKKKRRILYGRLIHTAMVILIGYLSIFLFVRIVNRRIKDLKVRHMTRRNVVYAFHILMILYIFFYWVENTSSIVIFLSVISAGIVLALQDVILSIAGWFLILIRRPFEVGDRIEMGGVKGDVIDIRLFETSLFELGNWIDADQSTGRIVNVPNSAVFKRATHNYSRGFEFIWNEIAILVTFESDWKRAEEIMVKHGLAKAKNMGEIVKEKIETMAKHYMIRSENLTPTVYVDIKDNGTELTLRYLTAARDRRASQDELCRVILDDFEKEENVNFAYPTYRIVR